MSCPTQHPPHLELLEHVKWQDLYDRKPAYPRVAPVTGHYWWYHRKPEASRETNDSWQWTLAIKMNGLNGELYDLTYYTTAFTVRFSFFSFKFCFDLLHLPSALTTSLTKQNPN